MQREHGTILKESLHQEVDSAGVRIYYKRAFLEPPEIEVRDDLISKEQLIFGEINERFFEVRLPGERQRQEINFQIESVIDKSSDQDNAS